MQEKRRKTLRERAIENNMEYLLDEWDEEKNGLTPDEVWAYDKNRYHWKKFYHDDELDKDFELTWTATPSKRSCGSMCPYLSSNAIFVGFNDLGTRNPKLAEELHPTLNGSLNATNIAPNSSKKVWWLCPECGHEYQATPNHRNKDKTGCPKCAKELQTSFPEYAIIYYLKKYTQNIKHSYSDFGFELDIYLPDLKIAIEYDGSYWHDSKTDKDLEKNQRCKNLGIKLYRFRADLDSLNDYSIDILCKKRSKSLNKAIQFLIKDIFNVDEIVDVEQNRCEIETNRQFSKKENSLAIIRPDLAAEWHPTKNGNLKPEHVLPQSNKRVWWYKKYTDEKTGKTFEFEWETVINNRYHGDTCPFLTSHRIWKGYNDLSSQNPTIAKLWDVEKNNGLTPEDVMLNSNIYAWWICPHCGNSFSRKITNMNYYNGVCPHCKKPIKEQ